MHLKRPNGRFNPKGCATPDMSAVAASFATIRNKTPGTIHVTSRSALVVASMITLINDKRLSVGRKPVGFLNPALYANQHVFNDFVSGTIFGCGEGFRAAVGWGPVTGLGTPDYQKMKDLFLHLP